MISLILMNLMFDLGVILLGEIRCLSLLGSKGLSYFKNQHTMNSNTRFLKHSTLLSLSVTFLLTSFCRYQCFHLFFLF